MPAKYHPHHKELVRTRRRFTFVNLLLVAALAITVGYVAKSIFANTDNGNPYTCTNYPTLQNGSSGACVQYLQWDLDMYSSNNLTQDGIFGSQTQNAVAAYQRGHGLSPDGVVGSQTWASINRETAKVYITSFCVAGNCTYGGTPANATTNQIMHFSWRTSSTTDSCTVRTPTTNWSGNKPANGDEDHHASNVAGTYTFDLYCGNDIWHFETTRTVKVSAPTLPPAPVVTFTVNNSSSASAQQSTNVTFRWSATNSPTSCTAGNSWTGSKPTSSTGTAVNVGSTLGNKTYTLFCTNSGGNSATKSVTVNVTASPPPHGCGPGTDNSTCPPPPPHGCGAGTDNSTCPKPPTGGGNNGGGRNNGGGTHVNDTTAPSIPGNFKAVLGADKSIVMLSWSASADTGGSGLKGYQIERSLDQTKWVTLSSSLTTAQFTDATTAYKTAYFYRVKAVDNSGNASGYAKTNITTGEFKATAEGTLISSPDGIIRATLPVGSLDAAASCSIVINSDNNQSLKGLKPLLLMYGPYQLACKTQDGSQFNSFKKPINVAAYPEAKKVGKYKTVSIVRYNSNGDNWSQLKTQTNQLDNKDKNKISLTFTISTPLTLAVMGLPKPGLPWGWISLILLLLMIGAAIFILYLRRAQREHYQDYLRRKYYNL